MKITERDWLSVLKTNSVFTRKGFIILGSIIVTIILIIASVIMTIHANNRIATARENGSSDGNIHGDSIGNKAGESAGYNEGNKKGYYDGDIAGYESGLLVGYEDGKDAGYETGAKEGHNIGLTDGFEIGNKEGYEDGYTYGFEEIVGNDYLVRNPTYNEVLDMLNKSEATSAVQINNDFEDAGLRTGFVWVNFAEGGGMGTSLVVFQTIDRGYICIEPFSHKEVSPAVGKRFSALLGESTPHFDDTIIRITTIW
ncbi:hypothetical protein ACFLVO_02600 [Chloroflexota bacterium]